MSAAPSAAQAPVAVAAPSEIETGAGARRAARRRVLAAAVALALLTLGAGSWWRARGFEETDDAQVDGTITNVSARVAGTIKAIYVDDNQPVKAGDPLADLDDGDLRIALDQARAQLAQAEAQLAAEDPSVLRTAASDEGAIAAGRADVASARAALAAARAEVKQVTARVAKAEASDRTTQAKKARAERLLSGRAMTVADYEDDVNAAAASTAELAALREALAGAEYRVQAEEAHIAKITSGLEALRSNAPRNLAERKATILIRRSAVDLARAQLAQAERNLSFTHIRAPASGTVARKALAVGEHVEPGQPLVAISQLDALWVTANFRETQLAHMEAGKRAKVYVDALGVDLEGRVDSVGGATGARMSVLPPENASGNYVKVVQRIPVRIALAPGQAAAARLRIGMSVQPRVALW